MVNVFDAQSLEQLASIRVADPGGQAVQGANHVAFSADGARVYAGVNWSQAGAPAAEEGASMP